MHTKKHWAAMTIGISVGIGAAGSSIAQDRSENLQEIVVTGSRIARPNLDSAVPVTTVSSEELIETGNTSVGDLLNELPQIRSTFSQANSSRALGTAGLNLLDLRGLGTQRTLVLVNGRRHVGSDILANAVSPDVNTFPTDLIERIETVTGGSSAVYGSDAIAGVVNFVTKKDFEGFQFRAQGGQAFEGDADNYTASAVAGINFWENRGNIAANLEYASQEAFFASDRENLRRNSAFVVVDTDPPGAVNGSDGVPDRRFFRDIRSATIANGGSLLFPNASRSIAPCGTDAAGTPFSCAFLFQPDGTLIPQTGNRIGIGPNGSFDGGNGINGREDRLLAIFPEFDRISLNVLGSVEINEAFKPFIEAKFVRTEGLSFGAPAFFQGFTIDGDREQPRFGNPFLSESARATINQARLASGLGAADADTPIQLRRNLADLAGRQEESERETYRIVLGVQGDFASTWNYETSVNYGKFEEDTKVLGNLNQQRFLLAIDSARDANGNIVCRSQVDPNAALPLSDGIPLGVANLANDVAACVPLNPFGQGNITPAMRNYLLSNTTSVAEIEQLVVAASVSGDSSNWFSLPAGPIGLAAGIEHREEDVFFKADDLVSSGLTFYNALAPLNPPTFEVDEVFTELRVPLLKDLPAAENLSVSAAGRYSDYTGSTGEVFAYNYGLEWAPIRDVRLRAGVARAVRAPNLSEQFSPLGQNFALVADPCSARNIGTGSSTRAANCMAAGIPASYDFVYSSSLSFLSGGNMNLAEEESDSTTFGVVFEPRFLPGFSLAIDYFDIEIDDVITAPGAQDILNACYDAATLNNQFCALFQRNQSANDAAGGGTGPQSEVQFQVLEGNLQQVVLNYASSRSRGFDIEAAYPFDIPRVGRLSSRLVYTRTLQRDDFLDPTDPGNADQILSELGDPRTAFNLDLDLDMGKLSVSYQLRYIGEQLISVAEDTISVNGMPPANADFAELVSYDSVIYSDVRAGYEVNRQWNVYAGVDNVADKLPPLGLTGTGGGSGIYEARGRYFYGGARFKF
jgi:outer membrane receptor protein involved in Fe transport